MSRTEEGMYPGTRERVLKIGGTVANVQRALNIIIAKTNEKMAPDHPNDQFDHKDTPRGHEVGLVGFSSV